MNYYGENNANGIVTSGEIESSVFSEKSDENKYSIYNYFRSRPAILFTVISGAVAILSFIVNILSYKHNCSILKYWNVDSSLVAVPKESVSYSVILSFVYIVGTMVTSSIINNSFDAFRPAFIYFHSNKRSLNKLKKSLKKNRKATASFIKRVKKLRPHSEKEAEIFELENEIYTIDKEMEQIEREILEAKAPFKEIMRLENIKLFLHIFIAAILQFGVSFCFFLLQDDQSKNRLLVAILLAIFQTALFWAFSYIELLIANAINKKQEYNSAHKNDSRLYFEKPNYPIERMQKKGIKVFFSNKSLKTMVVFLILSIGLLIITYSSVNENVTPKTFKVTVIDGTHYVSVFSNTEVMVLEKVDIADNTATVYTTKQRIVAFEGIEYEVMIFNEVNRIPHDN